MTFEQQKLLYEIAVLHNRKFYNQMEDSWTMKNYEIDEDCAKNITSLEKIYVETYGEFPDWKHIEDVWAIIKELKPIVIGG